MWQDAPHRRRICPADAFAGVVALHIAMFSDTYFPYISGVVRSIERLSEALRLRGHTVTIFGPRYYGYHDAADSGIRRCMSLPLYPPANIVLAMPHLSDVTAALEASGVDVVHAHSPFIMGKVAVKAARKLGLPVVFTHHSVYHEYAVYAPRPLRQKAEKVIIQWLDAYVHSVDAVIAPSAGTREFIRSAYGVDATVISNPITAPAEPWLTTTQSDKRNIPLLLFVGRLGKEKNIPLLLQAFALVRKHKAARLVLVGDGPERKALMRMAGELGISADLTITGFLPYAEVSAWYSKAALFVFPSYNETQGMVILEALAHGVPVVAVQSEASRAVLDECQSGRVTAAEPEPMAEAVLELLTEPAQLAQLGIDGSTYAQRFTAEGVAAQMENLYAKLVAAAQSPAANYRQNNRI